MNRIQVWTLAARPKTLFISLCPILIGTTLGLTQGFFNLNIFFFTLATTLAIQIGTNLANDYFDFVKGADTPNRKGFLRVTQAGLATPAQTKRAFIIAFSLAFLCGCYLIWQGGIIIAALLAVSILLGILYTGGPYPLAYLGISEAFAFLFFGPIAVLGTQYLQTGILSLDAFLIGFAPGAFSMAHLVVNNVRDVDEDVLHNKKTLAVRFGKTFGKLEFLFCLFLPYLPVLLFYQTHPFLLLTLLAFLLAFPMIRLIFSYQDPRELNQLLAKTGQLQALFTLLFCIGWML